MTAIEFILMLGVISVFLSFATFMFNWYGRHNIATGFGMLATLFGAALLTFLIMLNQLFTLFPMTVS